MRKDNKRKIEKRWQGRKEEVRKKITEIKNGKRKGKNRREDKRKRQTEENESLRKENKRKAKRDGKVEMRK